MQQRAYGVRRIAALFLLLSGYAVLLALVPREAGAAPPDFLQKAPADILLKLQRGEPQALIVLFDDDAVQQEVAALRNKRKLQIDDSEIQAVKAARYKAIKQSALSALPQGQHELLIEYSHLPMAFVRLHTHAALQALLRQPEVLAAYPDEIKTTQLTQSPPLIGQPPVALDTHGSGFDTLLAVYAGAGVNVLTGVAANDNDGSIGNASGLLFQAAAGVEYQIAVDGFGGNAGDIRLNYSLNSAAQADLSVRVITAPNEPRPGDIVTYTLTVANNGPQAATNVVLTGAIPATAIFISASPSCNLAGSVLTCNLGTLANGASVTLAVQATSPGALSNTVSTAPDLPDANDGNNAATVLVAVNDAGNDSEIHTLPQWGQMLMAILLLSSAYRSR